MPFTTIEIDVIRQAGLGRLATIQPNGTPQNSPVGFRFNETLGTVDITGYQMARSRKFRNLADKDKVAFVVADQETEPHHLVMHVRNAGAEQPPRPQPQPR